MNPRRAEWRRLADGRGVFVRPVEADDTAAIGALLMGLSPRSRRLRFHGAVNALPAPALRMLAAPDDDQHATLVAEALAQDASPRLVAEARWVRDGDAGSRAEFALAVADDWRRLGLARWLLARLQHSAAAAGVTLLYAGVLDENAPMLALLQSFGATPRRDPRLGHGLVWTLPTQPAAGHGAARHAPPLHAGPAGWHGAGAALHGATAVHAAGG